MSLDWDKLRIFHAVAEAGSFTKAGDSLGLSQSAVSRQISALEASVKTPLFLRHARGLLLTEPGEILHKTTADVYKKLVNVSSELAETRQTPAGQLKISATPGLGAVWLPRRLKEFSNRYPDIQIILNLSDSDADLAMGEADIAIRMHPPIQPALIQRKLFTAHFHVYASKDYLAEYGEPKTEQDLDNHRLLVLGGTRSRQLNRITWILTAGRNNLNPRLPDITVNTLIALKFACASGNGIAVLPDHIAQDSPNLLRLFSNQVVFTLDTYIVYTDEMRNSRRVTAFRDFMVETTSHWPY